MYKQENMTLLVGLEVPQIPIPLPAVARERERVRERERERKRGRESDRERGREREGERETDRGREKEGALKRERGVVSLRWCGRADYRNPKHVAIHEFGVPTSCPRSSRKVDIRLFGKGS